MTLLQLFNQVKRKSYFSVSDQDVTDAINSAARRVYNWVVKESKGFFLKWDTSLVFTVNQSEYPMQDDLEQIIRIREQDPVSGTWRIIHSQDILDNSRMEMQFTSLITYDEVDSPFKFYGPYVKQADGKTYINIEPVADQNRALEIVYSAKYTPIEDIKNDTFMMPEESHDVIRDFAIKECLDDGDDDLADKIDARAKEKLTEYLTLVRSRQNQDSPRQEPYL